MDGTIRFYYPDKTEIQGDDRICQFVEEYVLIYYSGGLGCTYNSGYAEYVIDHLLKDGIETGRDVLRIIAWKMGKISHRGTDQPFRSKMKIENPTADDYDSVDGDGRFVYTKDWKDAEEWEQNNDPSITKLNLSRWGKSVKIACLVNHIVENKDEVYRLAEEDPKKLLCELLNTKPTQIGTVGIINLLYFLSRGKYPIYDQFADRALTAIIEDKKPGDVVSVTAKLPDKSSSTPEAFAKRLMNPDGYYMQYKAHIEHVFGDYEQNYRWNRDIDRALWVYGHQFSADSDSETRC